MNFVTIHFFVELQEFDGYLFQKFNFIKKIKVVQIILTNFLSNRLI